MGLYFQRKRRSNPSLLEIPATGTLRVELINLGAGGCGFYEDRTGAAFTSFGRLVNMHEKESFKVHHTLECGASRTSHDPLSEP